MHFVKSKNHRKNPGGKNINYKKRKEKGIHFRKAASNYHKNVTVLNFENDK